MSKQNILWNEHSPVQCLSLWCFHCLSVLAKKKILSDLQYSVNSVLSHSLECDLLLIFCSVWFSSGVTLCCSLALNFNLSGAGWVYTITPGLGCIFQFHFWHLWSKYISLALFLTDQIQTKCCCYQIWCYCGWL